MSAPITLAGTLVRDPELRFTGGGDKAVCSFSIVTAKRSLNKATNEWEESDKTYWDITAWSKLAEHVADCLSTGDPVIVQGEIRSEEWNDKTTGEKRSKMKITARKIGVDLMYGGVKRDRNAKSGANRVTSAPSDDPWSAGGSAGWAAGSDDIPPF